MIRLMVRLMVANPSIVRGCLQQKGQSWIRFTGDDGKMILVKSFTSNLGVRIPLLDHNC